MIQVIKTMGIVIKYQLIPVIYLFVLQKLLFFWGMNINHHSLWVWVVFYLHKEKHLQGSSKSSAEKILTFRKKPG